MTKNVIWGWTGMSHDASLAVYTGDGLEFAAHSERYSRIKNDKNLHQDLIAEALEFWSLSQKANSSIKQLFLR